MFLYPFPTLEFIVYNLFLLIPSTPKLSVKIIITEMHIHVIL
jgi:hypothetical protein